MTRKEGEEGQKHASLATHPDDNDGNKLPVPTSEGGRRRESFRSKTVEKLRPVCAQREKRKRVRMDGAYHGEQGQENYQRRRPEKTTREDGPRKRQPFKRRRSVEGLKEDHEGRGGQGSSGTVVAAALQTMQAAPVKMLYPMCTVNESDSDTLPTEGVHDRKLERKGRAHARQTTQVGDNIDLAKE
ncbi:hypothetical protein BKA81DRAFT_383155 [Phyllosticta paracitricarpa]